MEYGMPSDEKRPAPRAIICAAPPRSTSTKPRSNRSAKASARATSRPKSIRTKPRIAPLTRIPTSDAGLDWRFAVPPSCLTLLTVRQAAELAPVAQQTVRRWIRAGHLPIFRIGRQIRIDECDLLALLCGQD